MALPVAAGALSASGHASVSPVVKSTATGAPGPAVQPTTASAVPVATTNALAVNSPHPGTLDVYEVLKGGARTMDPAVAYDTGSYEPVMNVYQTLVNYNGSTSASFVPTLATCVPGTVQCVTDYGTNLTGFVGSEPIYWTFVIDPQAHFYDPSTHAAWGVYPTDVMFSFARTMGFTNLPYVTKDPGWIQSQSLLPYGNSSWDNGIHGTFNNTPGNILGSMLINDTTYCPAAAITNAHGCLTFVANGGGTDWPFFLELVADNLGGSVVPCGWFSAQGAGMPGWSSPASHGDGPCAVSQLGVSQSTSSAAWASYMGNLTSNSALITDNMTSWDTFELQANNQPGVNPNVQFNMVGSGPYYAGVVPGSAYQLAVNPSYAQPSGCSGVGGLATYSGYCDPAAGSYAANVHVYWEPDDTFGISQYRAHSADFAGIEAVHTTTLLQLAAQGDLYYFTFPTLSSFFTPINLDWSSTVYTDLFSSQPLPNIPANFFTNVALREFYAHAYPYATVETTVRTVDGIQFTFNAGGPIPVGMGNYYPSNVSFPSGDPDTNPSDVGGAAWWWAQATNPSSLYFDPQLASCTSLHPCTWAIAGLTGDPSDDIGIADWIAEIKSLTGGALQPFGGASFDLTFDQFLDILFAPAYENPLVSAAGTGWAPDYPDPTDYMAPMAYPDSSYTAPDAFSQQLGYGLPAATNNSTCGFSATTYANLIYWAHQAENPANFTLTSTCQGVAYSVAVHWMYVAAGLPVGPTRTLDYNLIEQILNGLSMFVYNGQSTQIQSAAPWIQQSSINQNPMIGGGGDQFWFQIRTLPYQSTVQFKSAGLAPGTEWGVDAGVVDKTNITVKGLGEISFSAPNGTFSYEILAPAGYGIAKIAGSGGPSFSSVNVTGKTIVLTVTFGALTTLTFNQTVVKGWPGLGPSTGWSVTLTSKGGAGKPPVTVTTNATVGGGGSTIGFTVIKGVTYGWQVATPTGYQASGGKGTFTGGAKDVTKVVKFKLYTATVTFNEHGLPSATTWSVYVNETSAPFTATLVTGKTAALKAYLTNGTYTWVVPKAGGENPSPASGGLTIVAPHGQSVVIAFTHAHAYAGPVVTRLASSLASHSDLVATVTGRAVV
jgi:hypothetical protein